MRERIIGAAVTALLAAAVSDGAAAQQNQAAAQHPGATQYAQADIEAGARLYAANCTGCHGPNGDAVGTVNLKSGQFRRAASDQELMGIISNGIPGTGMPSHRLAPPELNALVAFLRTMRDYDGRSVALGDPDHGRTIFEGKGGCTNCHTVRGMGAGAGPDLTDIGMVRAASQLERSLIDPSAQMMPINRPVRVVTKDGKTISGRRLNEDTYTIQIIDDQGRLASVDKADLREFKIFTESPMPSFRGKLTQEELADLVAYLTTLKG